VAFRPPITRSLALSASGPSILDFYKEQKECQREKLDCFPDRVGSNHRLIPENTQEIFKL